MTEPRTEAGRDLVVRWFRGDHMTVATLSADIALIEDEAHSPAREGLREAYWTDGLPFTKAGQLEHSRQHREEPSEHTLIGHCPVAARIIAVERAALSAPDPQEAER